MTDVDVVATDAPADGSATDAPIFVAEGLVVHFPVLSGVLRRVTGWIRAVDGVDFTIAAGETLGLVGESGSGKTTIGRAIVRLNEPQGGSLRLEGEDLLQLSGSDLRRMRRRVQMVFQDPYSSLDPRQTVSDIVSEPLKIHGVAGGGSREDRVAELLELVGLDPIFQTRYPHEFSGGQRQRIGIARALAVEPDVIVADEPISALDVSIQAQVINLFERLQDELGITYLFIAHDPRGRAPHRRSRGGDVPRPDRGDRSCRRPLYRSAASVHGGAALGGAGPRPDPRARATADHPDRRHPQPGLAPERLSLPHALLAA